ncbi:MAG TPA: hypothetical protein VMW83_00290 [Spirochaetia bacterium]|nr:hypothetical protein [Spirochaetia bacterium]
MEETRTAGPVELDQGRKANEIKNYDDLTAHDRLRLVVDALARQDQAEAKRLYETCPDNSLECLDTALDKVVGFLVLNLLMAERRHLKTTENWQVAGVGQAVANLLAAAETFCAEIDIPLTQLTAISLQLSELIESLSPLAANVGPDAGRVEEITDVLRGCWEAGD